MDGQNKSHKRIYIYVYKECFEIIIIANWGYRTKSNMRVP